MRLDKLIAERFALSGGPDGTPCAWADPPAGGAALGNKDVDALGCPLQNFVVHGLAVRASLCGPGTFYGSGTKENPVGAVDDPFIVWTYPPPEIGVLPAMAATDGRAQSRHPAILQVGMGDGSARGMLSTTDLRTWLKAIDPHDWYGGADW